MGITADTIVAPATPSGYGGISVVRISGSSTKKIAKAISLLPNGQKPSYKPQHTTRALIIEKSGKTFDDGLITFYKSPNSYTGEDSLEISCHGNPSIVQKIIERCCEEGARPAEPGEFTRRSFLNGKIDLLQAEAVASLIYSKSIESASLSHKVLRGTLSESINRVKTSLLESLSQIEFELDFSEENLQPDLKKSLLLKITTSITEYRNLLNTYKSASLMVRGALVVIAGKPNVGKSTLLNALSGVDRAIVGSRPGTTRDTIEAQVLFNGVPVRLVDTAGLRSDAEGTEKEGILRAKKALCDADLVLYLYSVNKKNSIEKKHTCEKPILHIINKCDLISDDNLNKIKTNYPDFLFLSAKKRTGINPLSSNINNILTMSPSLSDGAALTTARQEKEMSSAEGYLNSALKLLHNKNPEYELVSFEILSSLEKTNSLLGIENTDEVIDHIFSSFCVGK